MDIASVWCDSAHRILEIRYILVSYILRATPLGECVQLPSISPSIEVSSVQCERIKLVRRISAEQRVGKMTFA